MSWKDNLEAVRQWIRLGQYSGHTAGLAPGHAQANLVMLPTELALDFLIFCTRNPKACPILDVLEAGRWEPNVAPGTDLRTDLPQYRVFHNGALLDEAKDVQKYWRDDLVSFLLGCSFTFESRLIAAGFHMRHIEQDTVIPAYETNIACRPAGPFFGPLVVSMRPIPAARVVEAVQITARRFTWAAPAAIGIRDVNKPDWGKPVEIKDDEVPVFWACGVTSQAVARASRPPFMITHAPGHMFITDLLDTDLTEL